MHYGPLDENDVIRYGSPPSATPASSRRRRRRRLWPYLAAVTLILLAGSGTAAWWLTRSHATTLTAPQTLTVDGQLDMADKSLNFASGEPCALGDGYSDITTGAQVTVTDETGKVIGLGQLEVGATSVTSNVNGSGLTSYRCLIPFSVPNIPAGHPFYGIEITHRGIVRYTPAQIAAGQVKLTLGS